METIWNNKQILEVLKGGGVAVMPTDTLYGVVGMAQNKNTVERIYQLRKRNPEKPCIILIGSVSALEDFHIQVSEEQRKVLHKNWPGPVSIVLDCNDEKFAYLHRGTNTLAFRLPAQQNLRELLMQTGPLIAPSANTEGEPPSKNIEEAKKYFGDAVDLYVDGGEIQSKASRVIKLAPDGSVIVLRA